MKGSLTNSELHEFLHDFQSDETKENLEEFYLHNWERSCHADLPEGVSERVENIKSLDPLLYSQLTHQKYIRTK